MTPQAQVAARLREQAGWCARLASPLYARLLEEAAADVEADGPAWAVLRGHEEDRHASALALRFLGAVHRLVLAGDAPALAAHYPSAGGTQGIDGAWSPFRALLASHADALRALVERPVQTNEVGRSAALLGGFLTVAREHRLPLRILEIGASAGFNLRWDRYHYTGGGTTWGNAGSPVQLVDVFQPPVPPLDVVTEVALRAGCDAEPIDATTPAGAIALRAYVWPDQLARHALLAAAIEVARVVPAAVTRADAAEWLAAALATPAEGTATVVYHSIVWQYLTRETLAAIENTLTTAGARATARSPLGWLRFEPVGVAGPFAVRLTTWPGGADRLLAEADPHGRAVRWKG